MSLLGDLDQLLIRLRTGDGGLRDEINADLMRLVARAKYDAGETLDGLMKVVAERDRLRAERDALKRDCDDLKEVLTCEASGQMPCKRNGPQPCTGCALRDALNRCDALRRDCEELKEERDCGVSGQAKCKRPGPYPCTACALRAALDDGCTARARMAKLEEALREIENCDNKSAEIVKRKEGITDKWIAKIAKLDDAGNLRAYALEVSCALAWCIDRAALEPKP